VGDPIGRTSPENPTSKVRPASGLWLPPPQRWLYSFVHSAPPAEYIRSATKPPHPPHRRATWNVGEYGDDHETRA